MSRQIADFRLYSAIRQQPSELERLLSAPEPVDLAAETLSGARRVFTIGIGSSWNAASAAGYLLRAAGVDATAWSSHDFAAYPPGAGREDAAVLFTHSGAKHFSRQSLDLLGERGTSVVLVTSSESEIGGRDLPMNTTILRTTPRDPSEASSVSYTAAILLAARVADAVEPRCAGELAVVPDAVAEALVLEEALLDLARSWHERRDLLAVGAGPREVSAHEAAVKVSEAARRPLRGLAVEQFLHGLQVPVVEDDAVLVFAGEGRGLDRTREASVLVHSLGAALAWVSAVEPPVPVEWLRVRDVGDLLAPIVEAVPAQLLAGHLAALADVDADVLRMDDPVFAEAWKAIEG